MFRRASSLIISASNSQLNMSMNTQAKLQSITTNISETRYSTVEVEKDTVQSAVPTFSVLLSVGR